MPDVAGDAPIDMYAGPCGFYLYQFSGTFLDWDSTTSAPCPIVGAQWYVHNTPGFVTTDANGAFAICLAPNNPELDLPAPTAASSCTSASYAIPGIALATRSVVDAGGAFTARALDTIRASTFYASFGAVFDMSKASLLVHVNGPPHAVTISSAHDATQAFDGAAWASGASGGDVYFPNIDLSGGTTTIVDITGGAIGTGAVPLVAGQITYMAVVAN